VNRRKLTLANIVILAAGAIMLIGSFMPFYRSEANGVSVGNANAWDHGLFLIATLAALLGVVMALQIGLEAFGNITMPNRVLGLTWDQFHTVLSFQALLLMLAFLFRRRLDEVIVGTRVQVVLGTGYWLMFVGACGLVLGAFMRLASLRRRPHSI
jgi:hypothetical protein